MKPSASPGRAFNAWAMLALAALSLGVSIYSISKHFEGGVTQEFCDYAEIGRNILEGRGFTTASVFPFTLAYLDGRKIPFDAEHPAPALDRFPLQSYLTAAAELILGKSDRAVLGLSAFLLALCVCAVFWAGTNLFGPAEGFMAAIFLALDPSFQRGFVLWGLPDFAFLLTVLAFVWLLVRDDPRPGLAGAAVGLAWLARSNVMIWFPLLAWALWNPREGRARRQLWFWGAFTAVSAPGWIYNLRWYGAITPPTLAWNLAHHVVQDTYPLLSYKSFSSWDAVVHHFPELLRKFRFYFWLQLRDFPALWQLQWLMPAALLGLYRVWDDRGPAGRFARLTTAMLGWHLIAFSFLRYERLGPFVAGRYLIWWAPAVLLLAARGLLAAAHAVRRPRLAKAGAALACLWFVPYLGARQGAPAHPTGLSVGAWPELSAAAQAAGPGGLIVTNLPGQMAWYGRHPAVGLPADPADLLAIEKNHAVAAVLISKLSIGELNQTRAWSAILADRTSMDAFRKRAGFARIDDLGTAVLLAK